MKNNRWLSMALDVVAGLAKEKPLDWNHGA